MLSFGRHSSNRPILGDDDIYFVDLGMVIEGVETDLAVTVGTGTTFQSVANASQDIWHQVAAFWRENHKTVSGIEMYNKASDLALENGLILDLSEGGHRIGPFPHDRTPPNDLKYIQCPVECSEWVLEIKVIDFKNKVGSFFESPLILE